MPRPKKDRIVNGTKLRDNLYTDPSGRDNHWRIILSSGRTKIFQADSAEEANQVAEWAEKNESQLEKSLPKLDKSNQIFNEVMAFIETKEAEDPKLINLPSWKSQRKKFLLGFSKHFSETTLHDLTFKAMREWWSNFTYHAQHKRRPIFTEFFNELLSDEMLPAMNWNPFVIKSGRPFLKYKPVSEKKRRRLSPKAFKKIYEEAGNANKEFLQIAMVLSLLTTMRRGDICALTFDEHVTENHLRKIINKSEAQKGTAHASALSWNLQEHKALRSVINKARKLSLKNARCPYLISYKYEKFFKGEEKSHHYQVLPNYLTKEFRAIRNRLFKLGKIDKASSTSTFHEVRSLASHLFDKSGENIEDVQELLAHSDKKMTQHYQSGHETEWKEIKITLADQLLKQII